jgi:hypothetical protein
MTINYPVVVVEPTLPEYMYWVKDITGIQLAECSSLYKANIIANALNAMHEFPEVSNQEVFDHYDDSQNAVEDWQIKFLPGRDVRG